MNLKKHIYPSNYVKRCLRVCNKYVLPYIDILTAPPYESNFKWPPIFIIGAPRSGSTLLFQVLTDAFDVAYLSNKHCQFYGAPALAERVLRPLKNKTPSDYTSNHGQTKGPAAPSECGEWWYRFFRRYPAYVTLQEVDSKKMSAFRRSLMAFTKAANKPLLFKNLYASIRLEAISQYVPEAFFIVIKRDIFYNAASILSGRKRALGNYDQWWSVPPPNMEELKNKSACLQVIGQIYSIYKEIERVTVEGFIDKNHILRIEYEELCTNTHGILEQIETFFNKHAISIERRFKIPKHFPIDRNVEIEPALVKELKELLSDYDDIG